MNKYDRPLATLDHNPLLGYFKVEDDAPDRNPKHEADAQAVRKLLALQRAGVIRLMVTRAITLEKQPPGEELDEQTLFARLEALGLDPEDILAHPRPIAVSTPDEPDVLNYGAGIDIWVNQFAHAILFEGKDVETEPDANNIDFAWIAYRERGCEREYKRRGIGYIDKQAFVELDGLRLRSGNFPPPPTPALDACGPQQKAAIEDILTKVHGQWTNRKCDAVGLVIHTSHALFTSVPQQAVFVTSDHVLRAKWGKLKERGFPGHIMKPHEAVSCFEKLTGVSLASTP